MNDEWADSFAPIKNADLDRISVAEPITKEKRGLTLRLCGQDKAPCPFGLTVTHLRRADIARYLLPIFKNTIKHEKFFEKWCQSSMIFISKGNTPYTKMV
jgi:hypothetical protein